MHSLNDYLSRLASEEPAPGGGSAAMVVGAAGCSLVAMVARICAASRKYEAKREIAIRLASDADFLRERMMQLRREDEAAFDAVVAARGDNEAVQRALHHAASVPLEGAAAALQTLEFAMQARDLGNPNLMSDAGCAGEFAYAALRACAYNVRINHKFMKDAHAIATQAGALASLEASAAKLVKSLRDAVDAAL